MNTVPDTAACRRLCNATSGCGAYTFAQYGAQYPNCYLKSACPNKVQNGAATSGEKCWKHRGTTGISLPSTATARNVYTWSINSKLADYFSCVASISTAGQPSKCIAPSDCDEGDDGGVCYRWCPTGGSNCAPGPPRTAEGAR